jgi:hypothetical protein
MGYAWFGQASSPHTRATRLPVVDVAVVGRGQGPLKALLAPLFAALDALPTAVGGDIGWCSLTTAQAVSLLLYVG